MREDSPKVEVNEDAAGFEMLRQRVERHLAQGRAVIGVCGPPGVGKSFVSEKLVAEIGYECTIVPMDGFHLSNSVLKAQGAMERKGAIHTFDGWGFVSLLQRIRAQREETVYAPEYLRAIEEGVAGSIAVSPDVPLVIVEGNYLLVPEEPWRQVRGLLDEVWYLDISDERRLERLIARHQRFGRSEAEAWRHALESDELNAELIKRTARLADVIIHRSES